MMPPPTAGEGRRDSRIPRSAVRLLVSDCSGEPVQGATLGGIDGQSHWAFTDAQGRVSLGIDGPTEGEVRHPAFDAVQVELAPGNDDEIQVVLGLEGSIQGTVRRKDGSPPPQGVGVLCWKVSQDPPTQPEELASSLVATDEAGSFRICGLYRGARYNLAAGAPGWACTEVLRSVEVGAPGTELALERVFGAMLRTVHPDGGAARVSAELASFDYGYKLGDLADQPLNPRSVQARLCGLPPDAFDPHPSRVLLLLLGPGGRSSLGPFHARVSLPGYRPLECEWTATPVESGLRTFALTLRPAVDGWGRVDVRLSGPVTESGPRPGTPFPDARILLDPLDPSPVRGLAFKVDDLAAQLASGRYVIEDVPAGRYAVRLTTFHGVSDESLVEGVAPVVDVQAGVTSQVALEVGATGDVVISVTGREGRAYEGQARFFLGVPDPSPVPGEVLEEYGPGGASFRGGNLSFERPPYAFRLIPPGDYFLRLTYPVGPGVPESRKLVVKPGEVTRVAIDL
jgi:hypothetical protein